MCSPPPLFLARIGYHRRYREDTVSAEEQGKAEKRRRAATRSAAREIGVLNAVAEALSTASDVRAALQRTLELVADLLGLRTGWVWLGDRETGQCYNAGARHLP